MFSNHVTTNFSQTAAVKNFWKSVNIWQRYGQNFVAYFLGHPVHAQKIWMDSDRHGVLILSLNNGSSTNTNLTLNQSKSAEIVFTDSRKRRLVEPPPPLLGIARHAAESARCYSHWETISRWACGWRHVHGPCMLSASCVHTACAHHYCSRSFSQSSSQSSPTLLQRGGVFRRLLIACASRHSFVELLDLVCGLLESVTTAEELVDDADERLFSKVRHCVHHVLEHQLSPKSDPQETAP